MKFVYLFTVLVVCLFTSCKPDDTVEPEPKCWEKFIGIYEVKDLETNNIYYMSVSYLNSEDTIPDDSLLIINFANKFDLKTKFECGIDNRVLGIGGFFPAIDHENNRWSLAGGWQDTLTSELENTLVNDTIPFSFTMDNSAFWVEDGTQYYSCNCKHLAVKISD